jgi:hypothetical protein
MFNIGRTTRASQNQPYLELESGSNLETGILTRACCAGDALSPHAPQRGPFGVLGWMWHQGSSGQLDAQVWPTSHTADDFAPRMDSTNGPDAFRMAVGRMNAPD